MDESSKSAIVIERIFAREIIDSRGNPTIETDVITNSGTFRASVPSGASTGSHEAVELRDNDVKRYNGKGVLKAVRNVNTILNDHLKGWDVTKQSEIDQLMIKLDGTENKSKLGANAILSISMAVAKAGAFAKKIPLYRYIRELTGEQDDHYILPIPAFNVINGGKHAGNPLAFQEFKILPVGANSFQEAVRMGCEVYQSLKKIIAEKYGPQACNVGDEGGFSPPILSPSEALEMIEAAIHASGHHGVQIKIGIDSAASEFYDKQTQLYDLGFKMTEEMKQQSSLSTKAPSLILPPSLKLTAPEFMHYYRELCKLYPIISLEDPFAEDDWQSFQQFNEECHQFHCLQIIGDDLLVTNVKRIQKAEECNACNCLLLKVNQVGSLTEALQAVALAKQYHWNIMVSHRSGETEDTYIADLAVGINAGQMKSGAPCRSERLSKYNQLLRIEEELFLTTADKHKVKYGGEIVHFPSKTVCKT